MSAAVLTTDVFGQVIADCHARGGRPGFAFEIVERDDGYQSTIDAAVYFADPPAPLTVALGFLAQAGGRVLDVGCGAGSRARSLQERGFDVTGLEESPGAAAVARDRGVTVVEGSLLHPPAALGTFDTFLLFDGGLARLGSPEQAPRVLAALAWHARPGAAVLADCPHPTERSPGRVRLRRRDGLTATDWYDRWLLTPDERGEVLDGSGWLLEDLWPGEAGYAVRLRRESARPEQLASTSPVPTARTRWRS